MHSGYDAGPSTTGNRTYRPASHTAFTAGQPTFADAHGVDASGQLRSSSSTKPSSPLPVPIPANDSQQASAWERYKAAPQASNVKANLGLDCPIRAGPHGDRRCGWGPKANSQGLPDNSKVREHVAFHGLTCPSCKKCFRAAGKWKEHRSHHKRTGTCLDLGFKTNKPQYPLKLTPEIIDQYFQAPESGKTVAEVWIDGFKILHPDWETHGKQLPTPYYFLNVCQGPELAAAGPIPKTSMQSPSISPAPLSSSFGTEPPHAWSPYGFGHGPTIDEITAFSFSEDDATTMTSGQVPDTPSTSLEWSSPASHDTDMNMLQPTRQPQPRLQFGSSDTVNPSQLILDGIQTHIQLAIPAGPGDELQCSTSGPSGSPPSSSTAVPFEVPPSSSRDEAPDVEMHETADHNLNGQTQSNTTPSYPDISAGLKTTMQQYKQEIQQVYAENEQLHVQIDKLHHEVRTLQGTLEKLGRWIKRLVFQCKADLLEWQISSQHDEVLNKFFSELARIEEGRLPP